MKIRTRIAPSPTGFAHVGTAYTSLFNLAYAKKRGGKFILRLEDTDQKRNVSEAEQKIYDGLHWLGIKYDEGPDVGGEYGPYRQSERREIYDPYIDGLIEEGKAYMDDGAVYLKVEKKDIEWSDLVRGRVRFPAEQVKDVVIRKSDGYPTYHFAVVIDDHLMKISHVIRAEDHISNMPKQIPIYEALGFEIPQFAHTPLIRNADKSKLSKRKNNVEIDWYRQEGYLAEAVVNFMCLLGWSHPDEKEIFSVEEFVEKFSLDRVNKTAPVFDANKLMWMNGQYIGKLSDDELYEKLDGFLDKKFGREIVKQTAPLIKTRIKKLSEYAELCGFLFERPKASKGLLKEGNKEHLLAAAEVLEGVVWEMEKINAALMVMIEKKGFSVGKFFMSMRLGLAGKKVTPPINDSMVILGKEETIARIKALI